MEKLLTPQDAAEMLGMTAGALAQLRYLGKGPVYQKLSPRTVRYTVKSIEDFVEASTRQKTSDVA
jgi:hypothetical protein